MKYEKYCKMITVKCLTPEKLSVCEKHKEMRENNQ